MNVRLTERDWSLLHAIYSRTVMSFCQIKALCFAERSKSVVHNRMTELERAGFIERVRVGRILHHLEAREIGVVFCLTRKALKWLQLKFPNEHFRLEPIPINTTTLYHDLLLSDVLLALEKRFLGSRFVNGKLIAADSLANGRLPDAVAEWPDGKNILAVELELTAKSEKRYRQIIMQYRLHSRAAGVLYVTATKGIQEKIEGIIAHKKVEGLAKPSTGKFYFSNLKDLLTRPLEAKISNGTEGIIYPNTEALGVSERTTYGLKI